MAYTNYRRQLEKLTPTADKEKLARLSYLIEKGAFYDEISDEDKELYLSYAMPGIGRKAFEEVNIAVLGHNHVILEKATHKTEVTEEDIKEVEELVFKAQDEYNSPEAEAKRAQEMEAFKEANRRKFYT